MFSSACTLLCRRKYDSYKELSQRLVRQGKLASSAAGLAYRKEVMASKGQKRKLSKKEVEEGTPSYQKVFKWKTERKR